MHKHILDSLRNFTKSATGGTLVAMCSTLILAGGVFYRFVEGWTWIDSFYFSVVTLTTVGYGDISPATSAGKLFTMAYILAGIGVLVALVSEVGNSIIKAKVKAESVPNNSDEEA